MAGPGSNGRAQAWSALDQQGVELPQAWGANPQQSYPEEAPALPMLPQAQPPQAYPQQAMPAATTMATPSYGYAQAQQEEPHNAFAPWAGAVAQQYQQQANQLVQQQLYAQQMQRGPMPGTGDIEPPGEAKASHLFGLATVLVGTGAAIGFYYGGAFGGLAGSLFGGAAVNAYRAYAYYRMGGGPEADAEAKVSGTYAVIAAGLASYLAAKHVTPRHATANPDAEPEPEHEEEAPEQDASSSCAIRKVGP